MSRRVVTTEESVASDHSYSEPVADAVTSPVKDGIRRAAKAGFAVADLMFTPWPGPRLLIYHQVGAGNGRQMDLDPATFRRQVEWLDSNGRIVDLETALEGADEPGASESYVITVDDGYEDFYDNAFPLLREKGAPFTLYLTTSHIETGTPLKAGDRPLNWDQVGEMLETGLVTLGAHTHTHPDLRGISVSEVEEEVGLSNEIIARRTGRQPRHFAYPKGYWDQAAEGPIRRHYETATLGSAGPVTGRTDRHRIPRVPVQLSDGYFLFTRRVRRGLRLEEGLRRRLRGYHPPPTDSAKGG
jgi:peptidoglycan/xylan/chitin deacetylase (PgdA/CDA1 family)